MNKTKFYALMGMAMVVVLAGTACAIGETQTAANLDLSSYTALAQSVADIAAKQGGYSALIYVMGLITTVFGVGFYKVSAKKDEMVIASQAQFKTMSDEHNRRIDDLVRSLNDTNKQSALLVQTLSDRPCIVKHL